MIRALLILLAAACPAFGQVGITVMADTNRAVRTNFTIGNAQVTGLSALLDAKLATNGNGAALTNLTGANVVGTVATASNITGILAISNGGTGSSSASNARTALGLGTAATNDATNFQAASTNLTALASGDGSSLTNISGAANPTGDGGSLTNLAATNIVGTIGTASGGTGGTNAASGLANLLPAYTSNASKVLAVTTNETGVEWVTAGGGGGSGTVTSVDASGGSTGMSFSGGPVTNSGTLTLGGTLAIGNGGTGASDLTNARINLLPSYTGNSNKVLALNSGGTDLEWVTVASGVVAISSGGTGATNAAAALINLGITTTNDGVLLLGTNNAGGQHIVIGPLTQATNASGKGVAIGSGAIIKNDGAAIGRDANAVTGGAVGYGAYAEIGGAVGRNAYTEDGGAMGNSSYAYFDGGAVGANTYTENGGAVGSGANSTDGFAGGKDAYTATTNGVQLGAGTNSDENSIQFRTAGTITTNEWATLAAISTYPTTNISVVGTNNTNTLVFSNGILTSVTTP